MKSERMHLWDCVNADGTFRMAVPGGWLYRYQWQVAGPVTPDGYTQWIDQFVMVFVPDPEWGLE